jgi:uncharacterized protein YqeY
MSLSRTDCFRPDGGDEGAGCGTYVDAADGEGGDDEPQIEKGSRADDDDMQKLLRSLVKQRRDSIEQYEKAGRKELVDKEQAEIDVIETYLPQAASQAEIEAVVSAAIAETGASSIKDMGKVMKAAQAALAGKNADGRMVSEIVKTKLSGS